MKVKEWNDCYQSIHYQTGEGKIAAIWRFSAPGLSLRSGRDKCAFFCVIGQAMTTLLT
jgi:hypothetical protein